MNALALFNQEEPVFDMIEDVMLPKTRLQKKCRSA